MRFFACEYVPSLHFASAPAAMVLASSDVDTADFGAALATAFGEAAGAAAILLATAFAGTLVFTPP